ncbi:hypothetical protein [Diaphorobacter sp. J5-51]|uniref:hypothetical protein n=1 Tax=Diaphorobacter sp. J5-51 TaxID=680496 RepID=UPI000643ACAB|nr:hypothetical protein [Diaphorobacter sp. J5-51]KLR58082.1 hypothetical protein OX89_08980 [Diaphorobacter sp. J5-51]
MRERPILFSSPMVRALLAGNKTQTRRAVQMTHRTPGLAACLAPPVGALRPRVAAELCPYGQPGDQLWVREAFARIDGQSRPWIETDYKATYKHGDRLGDSLGIRKKWTPSIHMPRHASRITLEITGVRVERLQDISEADAIAEGVRQMRDGSGCWVGSDGPGSLVTPWLTARDAYADLWDQINGQGAWAANPWVWVVEFNHQRSADGH